MSQQKIKEALENFGLTGKEAEAYILLAKSGPLKGVDIAKLMKRNKGQVYRLLKSLQKRGLIESSLESPTRFLAVPFETALDMFVKAKRDEASLIEESTKDLLQDWEKINKTKLEPSLEKFVVINGIRKIFHKISNMITNTKNQLCCIITVHDLLLADQLGVLDSIFENSLNSEINFRFLTDVSNENVKTLKTFLDRIPPSGVKVKGRNPELGLSLSPRMAIQDNKEIIFSITSKTDSRTKKSDDVFLWTNCQSLIESFSSVFEELWRNGTDIEKKISQIETLKIPIETKNKDFESKKQKYDQVMISANNEILMMITSENLIEFWKNKKLHEKLKEKSVIVKIMAPLTTTTLEAVKQLSKIIEIRHVPESYQETILVDGKHLFQFKTAMTNQGKTETKQQILDIFYTDNSDHVEQIKKMLNRIWKYAQSPSSLTLESIIGSSGFGPSSIYPPLKNVKGLAVFIDEPARLTENDVLKKMITKDDPNNSANVPNKMFSSSAIAKINPPKVFNLPEMMFSIDHIYNRSSFGKGNALMVFLKHKMPERELFISAGGIGDNPRGVEHRKKIQFQNKIASENYRLVNQDELQIKVNDNNLFAAWTVPISLYPKYVLPPGSIFIEGYGDVKTRTSTIIGNSGYKYQNESNYLTAFVTFIHPSAKYSGPGTDGLFFRNLIVTTTPPQLNS